MFEASKSQDPPDQRVIALAMPFWRPIDSKWHPSRSRTRRTEACHLVISSWSCHQNHQNSWALLGWNPRKVFHFERLKMRASGVIQRGCLENSVLSFPGAQRSNPSGISTATFVDLPPPWPLLNGISQCCCCPFHQSTVMAIYQW